MLSLLYAKGSRLHEWGEGESELLHAQQVCVRSQARAQAMNAPDSWRMHEPKTTRGGFQLVGRVLAGVYVKR
jgi:hypothetical protein